MMLDEAAYSCLLDEREDLSQNEARRNEVKAHLVFSALTQSKAVISDNQLVAGRNLRALFRHDRLVRELISNGLVNITCRIVDLEGYDETEPTALSDTQEAFEKNGKLPTNDAFWSIKHEFDFVEKFGVVDGWSYRDLNRGYEATVKDLFGGRLFSEMLSEIDHEALLGLISERASQPNQLGRQFLSQEIFERASERGIQVDEGFRNAVSAVQTAPYVTNLPNLKGYTPIYSETQGGYFDLVRGRPQVEFDETSASSNHQMLKYEFREYGLCNLAIDDVLWLRNSAAFKTFRRLQSDGAETENDLMAISEAHLELQILIEDLLLRTHKWSKTAAVSPEVMRRFERRGRISTKDGMQGDFLSVGIAAIPEFVFPAAGTARSILLEGIRKLRKKSAKEVLTERDKRLIDGAVERDVKSIHSSGKVIAFEKVEPKLVSNEVVVPKG